MSNPTPQQPQFPQQPTQPQYSQQQAPQQPVPQQPAPQAFPAPGYAQSPAGYPAPQVRPSTSTKLADTNTFALVAVILAFLQPIAAIVFGHIALGQIKRTGDAGRGLALTGLVIGYVTTALLLVFIFIYGLLLIGLFAYMADQGYTF